MNDLIAELEAATEGNRELDAKLYCLLNGHIFRRFTAARVEFLVDGVGHEVYTSLFNLPAYVSEPYNLTALMAEMPEGWAMEIQYDRWPRETELTAYACIYDPAYDPVNPHNIGKHLFQSRHVATPALALAAALLKSKENDDAA